MMDAGLAKLKVMNKLEHTTKINSFKLCGRVFEAKDIFYSAPFGFPEDLIEDCYRFLQLGTKQMIGQTAISYHILTTTDYSRIIGRVEQMVNERRRINTVAITLEREGENYFFIFTDTTNGEHTAIRMATELQNILTADYTRAQLNIWLS